MDVFINTHRNTVMLNDFITLQAAIDLGISRRLLKKLIASGQIRHANTGLNRMKVCRADVIKAMGIGENDTPKAA